MSAIRETANGIEIRLKVVPSASRSRIVGALGDALKIQVAAPPEKGKANAAVEQLIAHVLGISSTCVAVTNGKSSPKKTVLVTGITLANAHEKLEL